jgi:hypothetical protein
MQSFFVAVVSPLIWGTFCHRTLGISAWNGNWEANLSLLAPYFLASLDTRSFLSTFTPHGTWPAAWDGFLLLGRTKKRTRDSQS